MQVSFYRIVGHIHICCQSDSLSADFPALFATPVLDIEAQSGVIYFDSCKLLVYLKYGECKHVELSNIGTLIPQLASFLHDEEKKSSPSPSEESRSNHIGKRVAQPKTPLQLTEQIFSSLRVCGFYQLLSRVSGAWPPHHPLLAPQGLSSSIPYTPPRSVTDRCICECLHLGKVSPSQHFSRSNAH